MTSPLIDLIVLLLIVGVALWAIGQLPLDPTIMRMIRVIIIVVAVVWTIYALVPFLGGVGSTHHPVVR